MADWQRIYYLPLRVGVALLSADEVFLYAPYKRRRLTNVQFFITCQDQVGVRDLVARSGSVRPVYPSRAII